MRAFIAIGLAGWMSVAAFSQQFEIVDSTGRVTALAEIKRGRLLVLDGNGERSDYTREPRYDSTDGRFVGFFNFSQNRVLRFPRSGLGDLYTADLNDPVPQFRRTIRTIRPRQIVAENQPVPTPIFPGDLASGYGVPGYDPNGYGYGDGYDSPLLPPGRRFAQSQSVLIDTEIVANQPLPPVLVTLFNSGKRDLQVELVGLASGIANETVRLAPGERRPVTIKRDSGGQRIDYYRVISPTGETFTKQITSPIFPSPLYEVVTHEWAMQSIAIDRTGKSPNAIEDVNFQGKGIGRFPLPAGADLTSTTIDVKRAAQAAGNSGTVAPLVPRDPSSERPADEPLDRALRDVIEQQRRAVRSGN